MRLMSCFILSLFLTTTTTTTTTTTAVQSTFHSGERDQKPNHHKLKSWSHIKSKSKSSKASSLSIKRKTKRSKSRPWSHEPPENSSSGVRSKRYHSDDSHYFFAPYSYSYSYSYFPSITPTDDVSSTPSSGSPSAKDDAMGNQPFSIYPKLSSIPSNRDVRASSLPTVSSFPFPIQSDPSQHDPTHSSEPSVEYTFKPAPSSQPLHPSSNTSIYDQEMIITIPTFIVDVIASQSVANTTPPAAAITLITKGFSDFLNYMFDKEFNENHSNSFSHLILESSILNGDKRHLMEGEGEKRIHLDVEGYALFDGASFSVHGDKERILQLVTNSFHISNRSFLENFLRRSEEQFSQIQIVSVKILSDANADETPFAVSSSVDDSPNPTNANRLTSSPVVTGIIAVLSFGFGGLVGFILLQKRNHGRGEEDTEAVTWNTENDMDGVSLKSEGETCTDASFVGGRNIHLEDTPSPVISWEKYDTRFGEIRNKIYFGRGRKIAVLTKPQLGKGLT